MADNVIWSTIYLGNFADMDTDEASYTQEDSSALLTTFGAGAGNALANNIVDMSTSGGPDNALQTDNVGYPDYITYDLGAGAGAQTQMIDSVAVLHGVVTFYDGSTYEADFGTIQSDSGDVFLLALDSQPLLGSQGIDTITFTSVVSTDYSGVDQFTKDDIDFVCFGPGTRIETPLGPKRVDKLAVGDLVTTLDDGPQPIRWIGKRRFRFTGAHPAQPVWIDADSFAPGLPRRPLLLSPNHRLLIDTAPAHALHDPLGALAPAKALTRTPGIRFAKGRRAITYFTLLLPIHAVILAEGIATESLYPGPQSWAALSGPQRSEWMRLAAEARVTGIAPARLMLSTAEARAGFESRTMALPARAPLAQPWSARRRRAPPLPLHLARG